MDNTENNKIKRSVEYKKYRHDLVLSFIGYIIIAVIEAVIIFVMLHNYKDYIFKMLVRYAIILTCTWLPFIIYFLVKLIKIFAKKDKYIYFKTELGEAIRVFLGKQFLIDISFLNKNETVIQTSTFNITRKYPSFDDFRGKVYLVGLNELTGSVIIIEENEN